MSRASSTWYKKFITWWISMFDEATFREIFFPSFAKWWEKYLSQCTLVKHTFPSRDKLITLWTLNRQAKEVLFIFIYVGFMLFKIVYMQSDLHCFCIMCMMPVKTRNNNEMPQISNNKKMPQRSNTSLKTP